MSAAAASRRVPAMALSRKSKGRLKILGIALAAVVGYDVYKNHTGLPAVGTSAARLRA